MKIEIEVNEAQFRQAQQELKNIPGGISKAMYSAVKRTIAGVITDSDREVRKSYIISRADVRDALGKPSITTLGYGVVAEIKVDYESRSLSDFKVSPKRTTGVRPKGGLRVTVKKDGGGMVQHGFVARVRGGKIEKGQRAADPEGNLHVFSRKEAGQKERFPIKKLFGPSVVQMLSGEEVDSSIQQKAHARMEKNFAHEIDRVMKGYGNKK